MCMPSHHLYNHLPGLLMSKVWSGLFTFEPQPQPHRHTHSSFVKILEMIPQQPMLGYFIVELLEGQILLSLIFSAVKS